RQTIPAVRRARGHDGLERGMQLFGRRPLSKTAVTSAVHSDAAIAPGLLADPVNHSVGILAVVFVGNRRLGAARLAASVSYDARVTARRRAPCLRKVELISGIDGERKQRRLRPLRRFWPDNLGCNMRPVRRWDQNAAVDEIALRVVLGIEVVGQRKP